MGGLFGFRAYKKNCGPSKGQQVKPSSPPKPKSPLPNNKRPKVSSAEKKAGNKADKAGGKTGLSGSRVPKKPKKKLEPWQDPKSDQYDALRVQANANFQATEASREDKPKPKPKWMQSKPK